MGNLATSAKNSQATTNQQVGVNGAGASGASASGNVGKGGAQAVGNGISLVFNTGGNNISTKTAPAPKPTKPPKTKAGTTPAPVTTSTSSPTPVPTDGSHNSTENQAGGNIAVQISQTDQGSVAAGTSVSLAALQLAANANDALLQANTNATTLAKSALQTGADVAAVAIPTYAANEIASNPINPAPVIIGGGDGGGAAAAPTFTKGEILTGIGIVLSLALFIGHRKQN